MLWGEENTGYHKALWWEVCPLGFSVFKTIETGIVRAGSESNHY